MPAKIVLSLITHGCGSPWLVAYELKGSDPTSSLSQLQDGGAWLVACGEHPVMFA